MIEATTPKQKRLLARTWDDIELPVRKLLGDAAVFLLGILLSACVFLGLKGLALLGYPEDKITTLENLHFWGLFTFLGLLLLDLLWSAVAHAFRK